MPRSLEAVWRGHCSIPGREFQLSFSRCCYGAQAVSANASHEISHMRTRYVSPVYSGSILAEPEEGSQRR